MTENTIKRVTKKQALLLNPYEIEFIVMKDGSVKFVKKPEGEVCTSLNCQTRPNCGQNYQSQQTTQKNTTILLTEPKAKTSNMESKEIKRVKLKGPGRLNYLNEMIINRNDQKTNQQNDQRHFYTEGKEVEYQQNKYYETNNYYDQQKQENIKNDYNQPQKQYQQKVYYNQQQKTNYKYSSNHQKYFSNDNFEFEPKKQILLHGHKVHHYGPTQRRSGPINFAVPRDNKGYHEEFLIEEKPLPGQKDRSFEFVQVGYEPKGKTGGVFYEDKIFLKEGKNPKIIREEKFVEEIKKKEKVKNVENKQKKNVLWSKQKGKNNNNIEKSGDRYTCCCEKCGRPYEKNDEFAYYEKLQKRNLRRSDNYKYHEIYELRGKRQQRGFEKRW